MEANNRRDFLKKAALAGASALMAPTLLAAEGKDGSEFVLSPSKRTDSKLQSPNQKIPDRKTKCVIKTHINIKQNVIFGAKLKPV